MIELVLSMYRKMVKIRVFEQKLSNCIGKVSIRELFTYIGRKL